jgi:uracil-DNA glycosylase
VFLLILREIEVIPLNNRIKQFIESLATSEISPNVYNQYSYDTPENSIRRENLLIYLDSMRILKPKTILVGEAPGYRGCRLTGVPFTSEHMLINNTNIFGKEKGYRLALEKDKLLKEATATIIWSTLTKHEITVLAWNAFPFHPHRKDELQSNRTPLKNELLLGEKYLKSMIEMFEIENVIAMGNKAEESLKKLNINCTRVRHPAQGGKNDFVKGIIDFKRAQK